LPKTVNWVASGKAKVDLLGLVPGSKMVRGFSKSATDFVSASIDDEMNAEFSSKVSHGGGS